MDPEIYKAYDSRIIELNHINDYFHNQLRIEMVKYNPIIEELRKLPSDVQKKIFFYSLRNYHREKILHTPLVPSWMKHKEYVTSELKKSILDNVHFLHLEFNTLPENKEWIPGCQCDFCKNYEGRDECYTELLDDITYYNKCIHCYDDNYWNNYINYSENYETVVFDYLKDLKRDNEIYDFSENTKKKYL